MKRENIKNIARFISLFNEYNDSNDKLYNEFKKVFPEYIKLLNDIFYDGKKENAGEDDSETTTTTCTTTRKPYINPADLVSQKVYDNGRKIVDEYLRELMNNDQTVNAKYEDLLNFLCWVFLNKC